MGRWFLWALPIVAMINLWTAYLYARFFDPNGSADPKIDVEADSKWVLTTLQLSSLVPFCIGASTLILAMAGYALNEIFLYWFPNLLFSICFLYPHSCCKSHKSFSIQKPSGFIGCDIHRINAAFIDSGFFKLGKPVFEIKTFHTLHMWIGDQRVGFLALHGRRTGCVP
jgi:hypothetical protein